MHHFTLIHRINTACVSSLYRILSYPPPPTLANCNSFSNASSSAFFSSAFFFISSDFFKRLFFSAFNPFRIVFSFNIIFQVSCFSFMCMLSSLRFSLFSASSNLCVFLFCNHLIFLPVLVLYYVFVLIPQYFYHVLSLIFLFFLHQHLFFYRKYLLFLAY